MFPPPSNFYPSAAARKRFVFSPLTSLRQNIFPGSKKVKLKARLATTWRKGIHSRLKGTATAFFLLTNLPDLPRRGYR
jgi:hypothetical protein